MEIRQILPRTVAVIEEGAACGLHTGVQMYVSQGGRVVADFGHGETRPGRPMTPDTIMLWLSAGKPLTAVAVARAWERGQVELDAPVARYVPEFGRQGKQAVTVRHLLTHTGGFPHVETGWPEAAWDETIARICEAPLKPDLVPGERAGYHPASSWFILGEILQRVDGRPFSRILGEDLCEPLGLRDTWNGMPPVVFERYGERIGIMDASEQGALRPTEWHTRARCAAPAPGSNTRGPIRELGRFYEMLLGGGTRGGVTVLAPETVAAVTSPQRVGMFDETFRHRLDFGLGVILDSNRYGAETVPYGYGRHASPRTFGHGGSQSSIGFADPEHGLVVAWVANGMPGEPQHQRRSRALNEAIYEDLGAGGSRQAAVGSRQ